MTPNERKLLCAMAQYLDFREPSVTHINRIRDLRLTAEREAGNQPASTAERAADQRAAETARHPSVLDRPEPAAFTPAEQRYLDSLISGAQDNIPLRIGRKVRVTIEPA